MKDAMLDIAITLEYQHGDRALQGVDDPVLRDAGRRVVERFLLLKKLLTPPGLTIGSAPDYSLKPNRKHRRGASFVRTQATDCSKVVVQRTSLRRPGDAQLRFLRTQADQCTARRPKCRGLRRVIGIDRGAARVTTSEIGARARATGGVQHEASEVSPRLEWRPARRP